MVKPSASIHFVTGSDEAGVKKTAKELSVHLAGGTDAFGLEVIDGAVDSADEAKQRLNESTGSCLTLPFLGGGKVVWLKNATFLGDTAAGRSESVQAALASLCEALEEGLPDGVQFLLSAPNPDKRRAGYKRLKAVAQTTLADLPDLGFRSTEESLIEWVGAEARKAGVKVTPDGVEVLAARVGLNSMQLSGEIEKLRTAYGSAHEVPASAVRELVPQTRQGGIFDLSEAILQRDAALATHTLDQLIAQREQPVGILLAAITPTVRNLLLVKDLMERFRLRPPTYANQFAAQLKKLSDTDTRHLPRKKDGKLNTYPLGLAAAAASRYSLIELRIGLQHCAEAATQLFGGALPGETVLAKLLLQLMGRHTAPLGQA